jgi:HK97 family phage portal protein
MNRRPLWTDWSFAEAIKNGYKDSTLVYVAAGAAALAAASVPWIAETRSSATEPWEPAPGHPLEELMRRPNPRTSSQELNERIVLHMNLAGNGLVRKILISRTLDNASAPVVREIWNLSPEGVKPIPDRVQFISGYEFSAGGTRKILKALEIVHFMLPDPGNPYWGLAPLEAISKTVDTDRESVDWNMVSMQNRAVADGVFSSTEPMTTQQYEDYREMIWEQHQGSGGQPHGPWVLGGGFQWNEMSRSPVEMDFIESMKFNREMVLSGYHVPPVMAGFFDNATLANAAESRRLFWVDFIVPFLERMTNVWNRNLVPHFGNAEVLRLQPDLSDVDALRENVFEQSRIFTVLTKAGVPYNEASTKSGLDLEQQPDGGDIPFGITPTSTSTAPATDDDEEEEEQDDEQEDEDEEDGDETTPRLVAGGGLFLDDGTLLPFSSSGEQILLVAGTPQIDKPAQITAAQLGVSEEKAIQIHALALEVVQEIPGHASAIESRFASVTRTHRSRGINTKKLISALDRGDFDAVISALDVSGWERKLGVIADEITDAISTGSDVAAKAMLEQVGIEIPPGARISEAAVRVRTDRLVTNLVDGSRKGIRNIFERWMAGELGDNPKRISKLFKDSFSLSNRDAGAVGKFFAKMLEKSDLSEAEIGRRSSRLAKGYENARQATIGHQEASQALHEGQREAWRNALDEGQITSANKTWLDSGEPNRDPICISLHGQTVPIDDSYVAPYNGAEYYGPGDPHPRCNCGELYVAVKA